jgi:hypothetical protein
MLYGDRNLLYIAHGADGSGGMGQDQFLAIVLVNPPDDSKPLELEFAARRDPKLKVNVLGPDDQPIRGLKVDGAEATDDPSVFVVNRLNPLRPRRVTITDPEKHLIGFLMARGDESEQPVVKLKPWGVITGRLVSGRDGGKPRPKVRLMENDWQGNVFDPTYGMLPGAITTDEEGRFRIEPVVPGQRYTVNVVGLPNPEDEFGTVFEDLVLEPGETKDLGDVKAIRKDREAGQ